MSEDLISINKLSKTYSNGLKALKYSDLFKFSKSICLLFFLLIIFEIQFS